MIAKTSTFVALAVLVAAALCGSASAAHGRHLTTNTCPYEHQYDCEATCDPHLNCDSGYKCPCEGYYCDEHGKCVPDVQCHECPECPHCPEPPTPPPYAACPNVDSPVVTPAGNLYKVCLPGQNTCGTPTCEATCAAACALEGRDPPTDVTPDFCRNTGGGNCKGVTEFESNGPCCGCLIEKACST